MGALLILSLLLGAGLADFSLHSVNPPFNGSVEIVNYSGDNYFLILKNDTGTQTEDNSTATPLSQDSPISATQPGLEDESERNSTTRGPNVVLHSDTVVAKWVVIIFIAVDVIIVLLVLWYYGRHPNGPCVPIELFTPPGVCDRCATKDVF